MRKFLLAVFTFFIVLSIHSQEIGHFDPTFNPVEITTPGPIVPHLDALLTQPDGKILTAGMVYTDYEVQTGNSIFAFLVTRINYDGTIDKTFGKNGKVTEHNIYNPGASGPFVALQKDGKILVACSKRSKQQYGTIGNYDITLFRFNKNGSTDSTFGLNGSSMIDLGTNNPTFDVASSIALQGNGKILVAANAFDEATYKNQGVLVRFDQNGTVDSIMRFNSDRGGERTTVVTAYEDNSFIFSGLRSDGGILLYSSTFGERIIHNTNIDQQYYNAGQAHHKLDNGKIAVLSRGYGTPVSYVALLKQDGNVDSSFSGDGFTDIYTWGYSLTSQKDLKIIVTAASGESLLRLTPDGEPDATFGPYGMAAGGSLVTIYGNRLYALLGNFVAAFTLYTDPRIIKVNLVGNTDHYNNKEWNNWSNVRNLHFNNFFYSDSTYSPIDAVMSNRKGV
ncbi:MAG TPA: hypothetical protein VM843_09810, partial [Flavisolibacter sp.]|nr:hypothetical protein [Flavisolibacter sp.]